MSVELPHVGFSSDSERKSASNNSTLITPHSSLLVAIMRRDDERWMRVALEEARLCLRGGDSESDDVPIGAVVVYEGAIVARGHNEVVLRGDATLHAELLAVRAAMRVLKASRLGGATLYVTLEPCPMCAGALWLSRIERIVFGAFDAKAGACGSLFDIPRDPRLNHRPELRGGVLEEECRVLLSEFFETRRETATRKEHKRT